jgi:hypothetical protein
MFANTLAEMDGDDYGHWYNEFTSLLGKLESHPEAKKSYFPSAFSKELREALEVMCFPSF